MKKDGNHFSFAVKTDIRKFKRKGRKRVIPLDEIERAKKEYFARGGKITILETDTEYPGLSVPAQTSTSNLDSRFGLPL